MKVFKNIMKLKMKVKFHGNGCVNFDSSEQQKYYLNLTGLLPNNNDNNMFAKKNFIKNDDDAESFKYKVSSDCLRHHIFIESIPYQNPAIAAVPVLLYSAVSDPSYIMRGELFAKKNQNTFSKKSPLMVSDAIEIGRPRQLGIMEFHSVTTNKEKRTPSEDGNDKSSTSIYNVENVGELDYESKMAIDLDELQFIPDDTAYGAGRLAFGGISMKNTPEKKLLMKYLSEKMVNMPNPQTGYYYKKGNWGEDEMAEYGLLLNPESVDMIIKKTLKGILDLSIMRRSSYFEFVSMDVTVISSDSEEHIQITNDNLNDFFFEYKQNYFEASEEKILRNRQYMEEFKKVVEEDKEKEKSKQNNSKKSSKNTKSNEE